MNIVKSALVGALVCLPALALAATDTASRSVGLKEAQAVFIHAGMAASMTTLPGTHLHLHHVINCLEGVDGPNYSAKAEARSKLSCAAMHGHGAIADMGTDGTAHTRLVKALAAARAGVASNHENKARADARQVMALAKPYATGR